MAPSNREARIQVRQEIEIGLPSDFFFPHDGRKRGSPMSRPEAAPFLLQTDAFSCLDTHPFNRGSTLQLPQSVSSSLFSAVSVGFSRRFSPHLPSFPAASELVGYSFVEGIFFALLFAAISELLPWGSELPRGISREEKPIPSILERAHELYSRASSQSVVSDRESRPARIGPLPGCHWR
jgi:hypothetical protein